MMRKDFKLFLENNFQYLVACLELGSIDCRFFLLVFVSLDGISDLVTTHLARGDAGF